MTVEVTCGTEPIQAAFLAAKHVTRFEAVSIEQVRSVLLRSHVVTHRITRKSCLVRQPARLLVTAAVACGAHAVEVMLKNVILKLTTMLNAQVIAQSPFCPAKLTAINAAMKIKRNLLSSHASTIYGTQAMIFKERPGQEKDQLLPAASRPSPCMVRALSA